MSDTVKEVNMGPRYEKAPNVKIKVRKNKILIINKETRERRKYTNPRKRDIVAAFVRPIQNSKRLANTLQIRENFIEKVLRRLVAAGFLKDADYLPEG
jgi:hypothetical protein